MRPHKLPIAVAITATLIVVPAALAQSSAGGGTGGAAYGDSGGSGSGSGSGSSAQAVTGGLEIEDGAMLGESLEISGVLASAAGQPIRIERLDAATQTWIPVARTRADRSGAFEAEWDTNLVGDATLRAVLDTPGATPAAAAASAPSGETTVYRPAKATWYGPGFWGNKTACGVKLTKTTIGVAHKSLPCGTRVTLFYKGREIEAPVIDRGPFTNGLIFDLTQATARALAMPDTTQIGWVPADTAGPPAP